MKKRKDRPRRPPFRPTPVSLLGDGVLLFLCVYGALFSFCTAFSVELRADLLLAGCGAFTLVGLLIWSLPRLWWTLPLAGAAGLWGWGLWRLWDYLVLGEITLRCSVVNTFCTSLQLDGFIQPIAELPDEVWALSATLLVLAAALPLSLLLGLAILRARSFWFTFWVTFPFPLASICISVTPAWLPLMALVLAWSVLGLTSLVGRRDRKGSARLTLLALPAAALLLALLTVAMPQDRYQRPVWADDALDSFTNWAARQNFALFEGNGPFGLFGGGGGLANADGEVDLSNAGPLRFSGRTVLKVETDLRGRIYLRGFSGAVYDGGSWAPLPDETYGQLFPDEEEGEDAIPGYSSVYHPTLDGYQPMNFPALADRETFPAKDYAKITVRNVGADPGYVYTPYHILSQPKELAGASFVNDSYIARMEDVWTHTLYIQPGCEPLSGARLPEEAEGAERNYSYFVYTNYMDVPEESWAALDRAVQEISAEMMSGDTEVPAYQRYMQMMNSTSVSNWGQVHLLMADVVAAYLNETAEYNPDTPVTPEGEDFVSYFLTESHEGYCMHFASAATLMLRYLGVPARYVAGYVANVPSSGKVDVPDSAAHAWVEIYLEGYGWEPIEVTPAYEGGRPGYTATAEVTPTPTATPRPTATAAPQTSAAPTPTPSQTPGTAGQGGARLDLRLVLIPLAVVLVLLAFPARRALGRSLREKKFRQENTNRAVIAAYLQLKRLETWGYEMPEELFELAKKAKFSPHTLTEEERDQMASAARTAAGQVDRALPWHKKFWFRYILGLY